MTLTLAKGLPQIKVYPSFTKSNCDEWVEKCSGNIVFLFLPTTNYLLIFTQKCLFDFGQENMEYVLHTLQVNHTQIEPQQKPTSQRHRGNCYFWDMALTSVFNLRVQCTVFDKIAKDAITCYCNVSQFLFCYVTITQNAIHRVISMTSAWWRFSRFYPLDFSALLNILPSVILLPESVFPNCPSCIYRTCSTWWIYLS